MRAILNYAINDVHPEISEPTSETTQCYDINKTYHPNLVGESINKDGVIPKKLVDPCLQDLLTGDPFMKVHESKTQVRENRSQQVMEQAKSRSLEGRAMSVSDKRKPSIVT